MIQYIHSVVFKELIFFHAASLRLTQWKLWDNSKYIIHSED